MPGVDAVRGDDGPDGHYIGRRRLLPSLRTWLGWWPFSADGYAPVNQVRSLRPPPRQWWKTVQMLVIVLVSVPTALCGVRLGMRADDRASPGPGSDDAIAGGPSVALPPFVIPTESLTPTSAALSASASPSASPVPSRRPSIAAPRASATPATVTKVGAIRSMGLCITAAGAGNPVHLDTCDGRAAQRFERIERLAGSTTVSIRLNGNCLQPLGQSVGRGMALGMVACDSSTPQTWFWTAFGSNLWNLYAEYCLDIPGFDNGPGVELILWDCNNGENQVWDFLP
jgi:hypothetical protein